MTLATPFLFTNTTFPPAPRANLCAFFLAFFHVHSPPQPMWRCLMVTYSFSTPCPHFSQTQRKSRQYSHSGPTSWSGYAMYIESSPLPARPVGVSHSQQCSSIILPHFFSCYTSNMSAFIALLHKLESKFPKIVKYLLQRFPILPPFFSSL